MLVHAAFYRSLPGVKGRIDEVARKLDLSVDIVEVEGNVEAALASVPAHAEAVYLAPLIHLDSPAFARLLSGLNQRKLPTFSQLGRLDVERGVLAGTRPLDDFSRMGRRLAVMVQRILLGDKPSTFPTGLKLG